MAKSWQDLPHWINWRPRRNYKYYFLKLSGEIGKRTWHGMRDVENKLNMDEGNIFQTRPEAKEHKIDMLKKLKKLYPGSKIAST